ncbi:site-specific integrase [Halorussus limi]|uniref:Site-specific integrase n=1 Tax=Halorussus limi TaxID=2938695 RepID=A0A8U0HXM9_9EURY|nr:site-specific integrase [Halorussus limi]UPV75892.1 site-specific integrase [Halorussus limi]
MNPEKLSPREAWQRYIDRRRTELTQGSISTYNYRLKLWCEWCERQGIETVSELSGWTFDQYESMRAGKDLAPNTLHNEMETLKDHVAYLERIEAVDDGLSEKINVPDVPQDERSRETKLDTDDATQLIRHYRNSESDYGTNFHVVLELAWHTGARLGALRGLDLRDYDSGEQYVEFVHRPQSDTPLKNKTHGERVVSLRREVCNVVDAYIRNERKDAHDDHGRQPLFTTIQRNRPQKGTFRTWSYRATMPCVTGGCPHGYDPDTCEFRNHTHASKCPSSRSPHHIRTGSITWHRDCGFPREVTAERVNASQDVIDEFYDKATKMERMQLRRRPHLDKLEIE